METITFHCKVITPMFLAGADGQTPELRAPSIKGAMRFWWRALNGHLGVESKVKREGIVTTLISAGLRDQEISIFGGTGGTEGERKSSFSIVAIPENIQLGEEKLVPHKERTFKPKCILPESTFQVKLMIPEDYAVRTKVHGSEGEIFNRTKLIALFQVFAALGGLGKRVRRGMGSFVITSAASSADAQFSLSGMNSLADIHRVLSTLSPYFVYNEERALLYHQYSGRMDKYTWIQKVQTGENRESFLRELSQLTHDFKHENSRKYEANMGHAFRGRFASPVYFSVLSDEKIVVTTLNTIPSRDNHLIDLNLQSKFKDQIL
jgi:CRISPR-associated protein Cmr1